MSFSMDSAISFVRRLFGYQEKRDDNEWLSGTNIQSVEQQHRHRRHIEHQQENKKKKKYHRRRSNVIVESEIESSKSDISFQRNKFESCPDLRTMPTKWSSNHINKSRRKKTNSKCDFEQSNWDEAYANNYACSNSNLSSDDNFSDNDEPTTFKNLFSDENSDVNEFDSETFFEISERYYAQKDYDGNEELQERVFLEHGLKLSERCVESFVSMNIKRDRMYFDFYKPFESIDTLSTILQREGQSHRRCVLQIESAHTAKCTVINPIDNVKVIEISGRSKCGKTFSEDEVLVKLLQQECIPRCEKQIQMNAKTYGEIIGIFIRKRHKEISHPVLVCELDKFDKDKVKPICKTVPKIQLVSSRDKLGIYEVEIFQYNEKLRTLESKYILKINPSTRKTYLFFICIISWNGLYPIGAIIKVHETQNNPRSGLKILEIQHAVPTIYARQTLEAVRNISEETIQHKMKQDRLDLTALKVFTIDPPSSKDLDDALSIEKLANGNVKVGVHIADVTSLIEKNDYIDIEAQQRATTFYPGYGFTPYPMIPEPLTKLCSLLPNQIRLTLSVFMIFNHDMTLLQEGISFHKSIVKSWRNFTYSEVQNIIEDKEGVTEPQFKEEIDMLHSIAKEFRKRRFGLSVYACPVEIDLYDDIESQEKTFEAHCLVDEFMVLTNKCVADLLISKYPKCVPLRCQDSPLPDRIKEWLKLYPIISNLIFHLQGKQLQPNIKLAISNLDNKNEHDNYVMQFQSWVWDKLTKDITNGNFKDAFKTFGQDEIHPLQALALDAWHSFQETAKYKCSGNVKGREGKHFAFPCFLFYVHFTSPIRRYADIIVHRLFHSAIEKKESPYLTEEVENLCISITRMIEKATMFTKNCRALFIGNKIGIEPVMLHGFVKEISDKDVELIFPGLINLPRQSRTIPFNLLDVCALPKLEQNQENLQLDAKRELVVLKWKRRLYSKTQRPPQPKILEAPRSLYRSPEPETKQPFSIQLFFAIRNCPIIPIRRSF